MNDRENALREITRRSDESRDNTLDSWIVDLVDPKDEDCCGEQDDCSTCED